MNWNYILFGGAALGLVIFLPLGVILLVLAILNYIPTYFKSNTNPVESRDKPRLSMSGYFSEEGIYEERINRKHD